MDNKKILGQFYTTKYSYILQNINIPKDTQNIIEPFAGNGDLINYINLQKKQITNNINVEYYDIDPKKDFIIQRDTLLNPPDYNNKYIITNPPYLARNKSKDKSLFDKYKINDLYKCLIVELINSECLGGILILPINFWSSIREADIKLRKAFLLKYKILILNIFNEKVFNDTNSTVCSFQFELKINKKEKNNFDILIFPSRKIINIEFNKNNKYIIGGEIYNLPIHEDNNYEINRLVKKNKKRSNTKILVKCIDDNDENKISMSINEKLYIDNTPNSSARTYATLIITPSIDEERQKKLVEDFNNFIDEKRNIYDSLFLTNYRESKLMSRKRISFNLIYHITKYLLNPSI